MRRRIIAGNWKMHKTVEEAVSFVDELKLKGESTDEVELVVCPTFTALYAVSKALNGTSIGLGAQNLFYEESGAYTGEISPSMLTEIGCDYVIIGHSERRGYFHETDEDVNKKAKKALEHGIKPIICVGETLEQKEAGETDSLVTGQVKNAFEGISPSDAETVVVAYEPIWAIGTGRSATGEDANRVIGLIRSTLENIYGKDIADKIRIQYGGSVKPENIAEFINQPEIDGALVGGASLKVDSFLGIAKG